MINHTLEAERTHLASLLEAIQRCVYFLEASRCKLTWPLAPRDLEARRKDVPIFESLAAMNERFANMTMPPAFWTPVAKQGPYAGEADKTRFVGITAAQARFTG